MLVQATGVDVETFCPSPQYVYLVVTLNAVPSVLLVL